MVAHRQHIDRCLFDKLFELPSRQPRAISRVFGVGHDEVQLQLFAQVRQPFDDGCHAWLANDIAKKEDSHGTNFSGG